MTILVTGGLGVIGSHLARTLRKQGRNVVCNDMRILKEDGYRRGDITSFVEMHQIFKEFKDIDAVFHLAGEVGRENGELFPRRCVDINVSGTLNLAQLCLEHGAKLFFASTSEVYGQLAKPGVRLEEGMIDENAARPTNVYGISKLQAEDYLRHFCGNYGLKAMSFRFFMCYGEGEYPNPFRSAMTNFVYRALKGERLRVHRNTVRSWCYIDDIVEGMICALDRGSFDSYRAYNIGRDDLERMETVAELICELTGRSPDVIDYAEPDRFVTPAKDASFELAERELGFRAKIPLREGIERTIAWQKEHVLGKSPTRAALT